MNAQDTRAAAYIRVSTEDQTEFSPAAQLRAIKQFCSHQGMTLCENHIYCESNSAKRAETRPEFMNMIAAAKTKPRPFDVILVHKFDRFARNREDSVVYKSLLRKQCGIKVISITENTGDDKFSIILESVLEAFAEYYSLNLADEVKKGMTEKAMRGELQTPAPFGYDILNGTLIPNAAQSIIVKKIFELYVNENLEISDISKYLNDTGILTKKGNHFKKRSVEYILRNPVYTGKIRWNPLHKANYLAESPDGAIIVDGCHQPIIDENTFALAADKKTDKRAIKSNAGHKLSGLLKCKRCGGNMYWCGKIFRCGNYLNGKCVYSQGVAASKIESLIAEKLPDSKKNTEPTELLKAVYFDKTLGIVEIVYL